MLADMLWHVLSAGRHFVWSVLASGRRQRQRLTWWGAVTLKAIECHQAGSTWPYPFFPGSWTIWSTERDIAMRSLLKVIRNYISSLWVNLVERQRAFPQFLWAIQYVQRSSLQRSSPHLSFHLIRAALTVAGSKISMKVHLRLPSPRREPNPKWYVGKWEEKSHYAARSQRTIFHRLTREKRSSSIWKWKKRHARNYSIPCF